MIRARFFCVSILALSLQQGVFAQAVPSPAPAGQTDDGRAVSWRRLPANIASDQKQIWTFPFRPMHGRYLAPTLGILGVTALLVATDPHTAGYFRHTDSMQGLNSAFPGQATAIGTALVPASIYAVGLLRKDSDAQHTALLAGEAVANVEILTTVFKDIDQRKRPAAYPQNSDLTDSWFNSDGSWVRGKGSFPSGHTIAAFAVATVIARRYSRHRWVPYVAYGLAAVVGFSRITLSAHFPSDVFMGAALGYSVGRFSVLRQ